MEDLWAFNDEALARVIAEADIPVISAVGHETDFTIADFVADRRAPTPSAAAEIAVPDIGELIRKFNNITTHTELLLSRRIERARAIVSEYANRRPLTAPDAMIAERRMLASYLSDKLASSAETRLLAWRAGFAEAASKLEAMSPLAILGRGYAVPLDASGNTVRSVSRLTEGDSILLKLSDGEAETVVTKTRKAGAV